MIEHKRPVRNNDPNNAYLPVSKRHNKIEWEEANILTGEEHWTTQEEDKGLGIRETA